MSQSMLLPAFIALFGIVAALFLVGFTGPAMTRGPVDDDGYDEYDDGDEDYVECILRREADGDPVIQPAPEEEGEEEGDTDPSLTRVVRPRPAPSTRRRGEAVELLADPAPAPLIGFAHNGSHVDAEPRFRPIAEFSRPHNKHHREEPDDRDR
jgi:hypothetical protein